MTTLTLGYQGLQSKIKVISLIKINRINWRLIYIFGFLSILALLISYVFLVNELTEGTYLIKNYNKEMNILVEENRTLEANSTRVSILTDNMEKARELSFERTKDIKYVQILESSLAKATK